MSESCKFRLLLLENRNSYGKTTYRVLMTLASVTSPWAEKCSLSRLSSTCLGRFLIIMREVSPDGGACGGAAPSFWFASIRCEI